MRLYVSKLLALCLGTLLNPSSATAQCAMDWQPGYHLSGLQEQTTSGQVFAAMEWDLDGNGPDPTTLILGGLFKVAGNTALSNIAKWDGKNWSSLGQGLGASVYALTNFAGDIVAGGVFTGN